MTQEVTLASPPEMEPYHRQVLAGEYNIPDAIFRVEGAPVILDLGACCGFFSFWASQRWPGARISAYEASAKNFAYLEENQTQIPNLEAHNLAVMNSGRTKLYAGKQNPGQRSFFPELGEQTEEYETPEIIHPANLPRCHILKCDVEGAESEIIPSYIKNVCAPDLVMFEYHGDERRRDLESFLRRKGNYILAGGHIAGPHRGTLKYVRQA